MTNKIVKNSRVGYKMDKNLALSVVANRANLIVLVHIYDMFVVGFLCCCWLNGWL
jgi:hypothetical protein